MHRYAFVRLKRIALMVVDGGSEEVDVESQFGAILLDVGNLKAFFRRAVGEIGMRIGGGTKTGAT